MKKIFALALTAIALVVIAACSADNMLSTSGSNEGPTGDLLTKGIDGMGVTAPSSSSKASSSSNGSSIDRDETDEYMDEECDDWDFESTESGYNVYYCYDDDEMYLCDEDGCF
ncbi:MAG: hypothetical protein MJY99_09615 [Fibrobacter sp.]|nr:hypothetical protein [Fibrobacter sp.]